MSEETTGQVDGGEVEQEISQASETESTTAQPEGRQADSGAESATASGNDEAERKRQDAVQQRINKLVKQRHERDRENEQLRKRLAELEAVKQEQALKPPKQEDFPDYDEFLVEKARFRIQQEMQQERQKQAEAEKQRLAQEQMAKVAQTFTERVNEARKVYQDFDDIALGDFPMSQAMYDTIAMHEKGPDLAYYLGSNPDEADRIASLPPLQASAELGALAVKLDRPKPKKATNAPDPVTPVGSNNGAEKPLAELDYEEYKRKRMGA